MGGGVVVYGVKGWESMGSAGLGMVIVYRVEGEF